MVAYSKLPVKRMNEDNTTKLNQENNTFPKIDKLLQKLRHDTVELIEQGDSLTYQMHKLYKGVQNFVSDNMYTDDTFSDIESNSSFNVEGYYNTPDERQPSKDNCDSNTSQAIQKRLKIMEKPLCGYRFTPLAPMTSQQQKVFVNCITEQQDDLTRTYPYFNPVSNRDDAICSTVITDDSPVTVSSGYSSDKDTSLHRDTLNHSTDIHTSDCEDSLLIPAVMEDNVSFCDVEVANIHEQHLSETSNNKDEFVIEAEQLYQSRGNVSSNNVAIIEQSSFKPIVQENQTGQENLHNSNLKTRSDSFSMVRKSMKEIVKDLKDNQHCYNSGKNKVTRHHSLHEKHSQEYKHLVAQSNQVCDVTPPPITSLPGFHPAWCSTQNRQQLKSPHFTVSTNSAFRPYTNSSTCHVQRSKSVSAKHMAAMNRQSFSHSSHLREENKQIRNKKCYTEEPVYASVNSAFRSKTSTLNSLSSDSGRGSPESMVGISPIGADKRGLNSKISNSTVVYEHIAGEPVYEHVERKRPTPQDFPPKLPARNHTSKYRESHQQCSFKGNRPVRRHTLKLEDIIKPSDIVHTDGKHMYTVSDILKSVDKLNQEIPTQCENVYSPQPSLKGHRLRRAVSHVSVNKSLGRSFSSCCNINQDSISHKKLKKLISPIRPKTNDCNTAQTKRLCKVNENPTEICFSESPNSPGLFVIPTKYGLQFKSRLDDDSKQISKSMSQLTLTSTCNKPAINWLGRNTGKEIFC